MLTFLARRRLDAFEKQYNYDLSYAREILRLSPRALWLFTQATRIGRFREGIPREVWIAAQITALIHEDCGPCVQLGVRLAREQGIPDLLLRALVTGDLDALPPECALGARFARAVLARSAEADELREKIVARHGKLALVSLAFAITAARIYPTVKYTLGYGRACTRVHVGDVALAPGARDAPPAVPLTP